MKSINTLVQDIEDVIKGKGGWTKAVNEYFKESMGQTAERRFVPSTEPRAKTLRMSNIGTPCRRKLWYYLNLPEHETDLPANAHLKFAYGDIIEGLILSLAKAAGHTVEGEQDEIIVDGIVGHRDAVIDGVTVDVKSVSTMGFAKFKKNELRADDPFGYMKQLTGYVYGAKEDPLVIDKTGGAFLVMDKTTGHIVLDYYSLEYELFLFQDQLSQLKKDVTQPKPPSRYFSPIPDGKSGNMMLPVACGYCDFKEVCHPTMRTFLYSNGPKFLTTVAKLPLVPEFKP
jgi:hypothetical protein